MNKFTKITLLTISILLSCFLLWAGYYTYNYLKTIKEIGNSLFTIPKESRNSIEWNSFIILENAGIVNKDPQLEIVSKASEVSGEKIYTIPNTLYVGEGNEFNKYCEIMRVVKYSSNSQVLTFESTECL